MLMSSNKASREQAKPDKTKRRERSRIGSAASSAEHGTLYATSRPFGAVFILR